MSHIYCPECGYNNPESARFCAKCGAALVVHEEGEQTETFHIGELGDWLDTDVSGSTAQSSSSAEAGGAGETFAVTDSPTVIGRSPECGIFLDDVTVSRKHAGCSRRTPATGGSTTRAAQRHVRQPRARRSRPSSATATQIPWEYPAHLPSPLKPPMSTTEAPSRQRRFLTIGTVCGRLHDEFPDVSISKIRYLEDQASSLRGARRAATGSSPRTTSSGSRRSSGYSGTSSCRSA